jgi:hypothetical protein
MPARAAWVGELIRVAAAAVPAVVMKVRRFMAGDEKYGLAEKMSRHLQPQMYACGMSFILAFCEF